MIIDNNTGNVGIGTTTPAYKLDVNGKIQLSDTLIMNGGAVLDASRRFYASDGAVSQAAYSHSGDGNTGIYFPSSNDNMGFVTNGVERLRVDSSGNVGIGVISPTHKLHVNGSVNITGDLYVNQSSVYIGNKKLSNDEGVLKWDGTQVATGQNFAYRGFISGFTYSYKDGDEIKFNGGALEIDGSVYYLESSTDVDMDARLGSSFSASTWYYIYIDPPSSGSTLGSADFEVSASAPVWNDSTSSWRSGTSSDWRCIGVFQTTGGSVINPFYLSGGSWNFMTSLSYSTGSPTTLTLLSIGLPSLGRLTVFGSGRAYGDTGNGYLYIAPGDSSSATMVAYSRESGATTWGAGAGFTTITNTNQQIKYSVSSNSNAGSDVYVRGFFIPSGMAE